MCDLVVVGVTGSSVASCGEARLLLKLPVLMKSGLAITARSSASVACGCLDEGLVMVSHGGASGNSRENLIHVSDQLIDQSIN